MTDRAFDRRLIVPMVLGAILNPINSSIIAVSLVPIGAAFGAAPSQTAWLVSGLYVATAIGQPVVGRLVDLFGPRPLYVVSTTIIGLAGVMGVLAPSLGVLIAARVLLGLGTCAGYPAAMYLIRSEARRTGVDSPSGILTLLAISTQTISVIGPTLGGLLIGLAGWRATFAVNIPLSIACLVFGATWLPRRTFLGADPDRARARDLDLLGMASFAVLLVSALLFVMNPRLEFWWLLGVAVIAGAVFVLRERRAREPFIDLRVLGGNLPLVATYARSLLTMVVSYTLLYGYTQWLEDGRGLSPTHAGLLLLPLFVTGIGVSTLTGRRREVRGKLVVGGLAQIVVCVLLLTVDAHSALWLLVGIALVAGLPQGLNNLANQNALYHQADPDRMGSSAGLLRTFGYLGAMTASAANAAFLHQRADTAGMHDLAVFMLVVAVLLIVVTLVDRSLGRVAEPATTSPVHDDSPDLSERTTA